MTTEPADLREQLLDVIHFTECANAGCTPEDLLGAVRNLIGRLADLIDPDALVWFAPAKVRDAASDLLAAAAPSA